MTTPPIVYDTVCNRVGCGRPAIYRVDLLYPKPPLDPVRMHLELVTCARCAPTIAREHVVNPDPEAWKKLAHVLRQAFYIAEPEILKLDFQLVPIGTPV